MKEIKSRVELRRMVLDFEKSSCKIPLAFEDMIIDIVDVHLSSLAQALGNLELCFRRTMAHHGEFKEKKGQSPTPKLPVLR